MIEININELTKDSELFNNGKAIETAITGLVDILRHPHFPNEEIRKLAQIAYLLIHNGFVKTAMAAKIPSIGFYLEINKKKFDCIILLPENWTKRIEENINNEIGGFLASASKCKDTFNHKFRNEEELVERSNSYEAEWLIYVKKEDPSYKLSDHQKKVLAKYPLGVKSNPNHYEGVKIDLPG